MSKNQPKPDVRKRLEQERREIQKALDETIEETLRQAGPGNALAWLAVTGGAFLLNLGLLVLVTGG